MQRRAATAKGRRGKGLHRRPGHRFQFPGLKSNVWKDGKIGQCEGQRNREAAKWVTRQGPVFVGTFREKSDIRHSSIESPCVKVLLRAHLPAGNQEGHGY